MIDDDEDFSGVMFFDAEGNPISLDDDIAEAERLLAEQADAMHRLGAEILEQPDPPFTNDEVY